MKVFRVIIKVLCLILVAGLVMTAIYFRKNDVDIISLQKSDDIRAESVLANATDRQFKRITESGYLRMYFNEETTAIIIRDTAGGKKWYSMPNGTEASMVSMTVSAPDGTHTLNSQSCSVAFSAYEYEIKANGLKIKYTMSEKAVSDITGLSKNDIVFLVTVDYTLKDGNFFVKSEIENLSGNENCAVTDFSVLEYFGAFDSPDKEDFILIPDGCGAAAYPYYESGENEYSCRVYGDDYAFENKKSGHALMGTFGMKCGDSAYAAIIDSPQELAEIKAVSSKNGFSRVYADFTIDYAKKDGNSLYRFRNSCDSISICYKFLSKGNATYSDIASACREQLIRNGTFSTSSIKSSDDIPVVLNLTGAYRESRGKLKYEEYTTFTQAEDIIKRIKSKGVNNLSVRYSGVFENSSTDIIKALGGKSGLQKLAAYTKSQNVDLYLDLDIITYQSALGKFDFSSARAMNKRPFAITVKNRINDVDQKYQFRTIEKANSFIDSAIGKIENYGISGFCFSDTGRILTSDFSASGVNRTDAKLGVISHISAVSAVGKTMVDTGNVYTVKGASSIINIPMSVSYEEGQQYKAIPFVQSVLHGMTVLSSDSINTEENSKEATLKCIEYGICPSFSVVYTRPEGCKKNIEFDSAANGIIEAYTDISDALDSLEGERITSHSQIKDGVFCTTYSNSARIYVNYNSSDVSVNGVAIPAESYIRID